MTISILIGWIGVALYVVAYMLLSVGIIKAETIRYHLLNVLGAIGLIVNAIPLNDVPGIIVNIAWLIIGFFGIILIIKERRKASGTAKKDYFP